MSRIITIFLFFVAFVMLVGGGFFLTARWNADMVFLRTELQDVRQQVGLLSKRVDAIDSGATGVRQSEIATVSEPPSIPAIPANTPPAVYQNKLPELPADLSALESDMAAAQAQLAEIANTQAPLPSSGNKTFNLEELQRQSEEADRVAKQQFEQLDIHFAAEGVDNEWGSISTNALQQGIDRFVLSRPDAGTILNNLECKQTLCVLDVEHKNIDEQTRFQMELMILYPQHFSGSQLQREVSEDGRVRTVTYLAKKGESFPKTEPTLQ